LARRATLSLPGGIAHALAGVVHDYMQVKADVRQPLVFAAVLAVLLGYRLLDCWRRRQPAPATTAKPKAEAKSV
jgi:DMSO/TMAO reductase YedYZ heme-binding membrane subunit